MRRRQCIGAAALGALWTIGPMAPAQTAEQLRQELAERGLYRVVDTAPSHTRQDALCAPQDFFHRGDDVQARRPIFIQSVDRRGNEEPPWQRAVRAPVRDRQQGHALNPACAPSPPEPA